MVRGISERIGSDYVELQWEENRRQREALRIPKGSQRAQVNARPLQ